MKNIPIKTHKAVKESVKTDGKIDNILGVHVIGTDKEKVLREITRKITSDSKFTVVTPNPEIVLKAYRDDELRDILNRAEVSLPDGVGLAYARSFNKLSTVNTPLLRDTVLFFKGIGMGVSSIFNRKLLFNNFSVINGRVVFQDLIDLAEKKKWRVYLLGGDIRVVKKAGENLKRRYGDLSLRFEEGPRINEKGEVINQKEKVKEERIIRDINKFRPHLLFVGFGAPKQEKWLKRNLSLLSINAGMVVGGAIDYLAGKLKLPPKWMEKRNLEWLWRVVNEPKRIKRIVNAVIVFPFTVYRYKISNK